MIYSTLGSEFILISTRNEYVGLYHYYKGIPYSGADSPKPSTRLSEFQFGVEALEFNSLHPTFGQHLDDPVSFKPSPLEKDYRISSITRYFVKNMYTKTIFEVSKPTYTIYKKKDIILKNLYETIKLVWKISGPLNDVLNSSGTIVETGIIETNQKSMALYKAKFPELPLVIPAHDLAKITS